MTEPVLGSSLPRNQDVHSSHHHHNHVRYHHDHDRLHERQDASSESETVVQVVQTVSVVQLVDASGATVGTATQSAEPLTTEVPATETDATSSGVLSNPDVTSTATSIGDNVTDLVSTIPATTASSINIDSSTSSMPSSFPSVESYAQITSTPLSGSATAFPTFAAVTNSTIAQDSTTTPATPIQTSATSLFSNGTATTSKSFVATDLTTSTLPSSAGTVLFNETFTTTLFGSSASPSSTSAFASTGGTATSTGTEDGGFATGLGGSSGGGATGESSPSSTSTVAAGSGSSSTQTPVSTVAGSVLGGVAGVALILVAALLLLRYKKRQNGRLRLSDSAGFHGSRGLLSGGGGPSSEGPQGSGGMSERQSTLFAVPAALASLTGYKRSSQRMITPSEGGEKGFQKVSGRKLPSVLQHGGDGYSDPTNPRDTVLSDQSFYRDSQGFYGGPDIPRLAVGSPMRPESGVPIFHSGPARTPVQEQAFFSSSPTLEPPPRRDPLGRSHPSQDGSSRSRFTEEI